MKGFDIFINMTKIARIIEQIIFMLISFDSSLYDLLTHCDPFMKMLHLDIFTGIKIVIFMKVKGQINNSSLKK